MKTNFSYLTLLAAFVLAAVVSVPLIARHVSKASSFFFEVTLQSSTNGIAQIYYDIGKGIREEDSTRLQITESQAPTVCYFKIPAGDYRALRFDPIDREATVTFFGAKVLDPKGKVINNILASQFRAAQQIGSLKIDGESVLMTTIVGANDPILVVALEAPFSLKADKRQLLAWVGLAFLVIFAMCVSLLWLAEMFYLRRREQITVAWRWLTVRANDRPKIAIAGMAIFAVVLSCYPVVFFGKSFVSPNNGTILLYEIFPTLPGYENTSLEDVKGSDIGATMWADIPYSVIESQAIFQDFEMPLWDRYNSSGVTLLGQNLSMLGDPLHMIVILAGGASWAWDIKYLLAKIFFASGLGLAVYAATSHLPSSLIAAFSSAFIGFFS